MSNFFKIPKATLKDRFNTEFYSFEDKNKEAKLFSSENTNEGGEIVSYRKSERNIRVAAKLIELKNKYNTK